MNAAPQNSSTISETLKARKAHLTALIQVINTEPEKNTAIQKLTINAIKAEMGLIDNKLKIRR